MKIDGREIARKIFEDLKKRVGELRKKNIIPHLAIILVGDDPASKAYVRQKELKAAEIGAKTTILKNESRITNKELLKTIEQLNNDNNIHGIIIQRPLPSQINNTEVNLAVDPKKDIDAFHPKTQFTMPLAAAVIKILQEVFYSSRERSESRSQFSTSSNNKPFENWLKSKNIVVIGKGETGGGPVIKLLRTMNIAVSIIDSKTEHPEDTTKHADIIVSTVGKENILKTEMLKKDVILIGIGMFKGADGKLRGDYEENDVKEKALYYSPIPGGVGPVNVAMLLENLIISAESI